MNWWARARGSVRLRVTLLAAGVFAVTLIVASVLLLRALESNLEADIREGDEAALHTQAEALETEGIPPYAQVFALGDGEAAQWDAMGQTFLIAVERDDRGEPIPAPDQTVAASQAATLGVSAGGVPGDVLVSSSPIGGTMLSTFSPLADMQATLDTTRHLLWFVGPALVALVAGLAWVLAGRALRPVRAMTSRVAGIESRSLHERVPEPASGDEIAELAQTMNEMLGRLERATDTSRRLVSDASHELRTPVAVMRTELEVAQRAPRNDWSATSDVLLGELDRLQVLVDDLLLLARGDERSLTRNEIDVALMIREVTARSRRVPVDSQHENVATVTGDTHALTRALDHLVTNAARSAELQVAVSVDVDGDLVAIHVDDDGPGIPASQRSLAVQRFVRLDEGRGRDQGGAGLGLAVASDVAAAHGGRLVIADSPLGGARVSIVLRRRGR